MWRRREDYAPVRGPSSRRYIRRKEETGGGEGEGRGWKTGPVPQECRARNSEETRGDTCRLEAKYIGIAESTRMRFGHTRAPLLSFRFPSSPSFKSLAPRSSSVFQLRDSRQRDGGGHPRRASAFPAKKLAPSRT